MRKIFSFLTSFVLSFEYFVSKVVATGSPEDSTEKLPETNIMSSINLFAGLGIMILALLVYNLRFSVAKMKKQIFENKILGDFEED
jgi:LPXTG-motif cell wall-anchored protein